MPDFKILKCSRSGSKRNKHRSSKTLFGSPISSQFDASKERTWPKNLETTALSHLWGNSPNLLWLQLLQREDFLLFSVLYHCVRSLSVFEFWTEHNILSGHLGVWELTFYRLQFNFLLMNSLFIYLADLYIWPYRLNSYNLLHPGFSPYAKLG